MKLIISYKYKDSEGVWKMDIFYSDNIDKYYFNENKAYLELNKVINDVLNGVYLDKGRIMGYDKNSITILRVVMEANELYGEK